MCNHFKVLPTEERYLKLTENQKMMLFLGFVENPLDEILHENYAQQQASAEYDLGEEDVAGMKQAGYTEDQIEQFRQELAEAAQAEGDQ